MPDNTYNYPILEFDATREALLEPHMTVKVKDVSEYCVICFFNDIVTKVAEEKNAKVVSTHHSEMGKHFVYEMEYEGRKINFFQPGIGGPLAVAMLEEVIAIGCRKFIAAGGCGALSESIECGKIIIPAAAVRDEGISYHYLPPAREVSADVHALKTITGTLDNEGVDYILAKTWTTDAVYRETEIKAAKRLEEGCLTVEMEAASLMAAAQFRNVPFGQLLYAGDLVCKTKWEYRNWNRLTHVREQLFWLAVKACLAL